VNTKEWARVEYGKWILEDTYRFNAETKIVPDICEQPHREMCEQLKHMEPDFEKVGQRKLLFLAPRYSYKTSCVIGEICRLILKYPDIALGAFRANRELSTSMIRDAKMHLTTNDVILDTFGDISSGSDRWAENEIISNRRTRPQLSPTLFAASIGTTTTGMHMHAVFADDLVVRENCDSIKEMQDARVLIQSLNPVLGPYGRLVCSGTIWSNIDLYNWILSRNRKAIEKGEPPPFETYIRSAYYLDADGEQKLFFPNVLTAEFLEAERRELEPRYFYSWYYNQAYESGLKPFTNLHFFDGEYSASPYHHVVLTDDAFAGERVPLAVAILIDPAKPEELAEAERLNQRIVQRALRMDGTCTGEHGVGLHKMGFLLEEHGEVAVDTMRSIKHALDPRNLMNPGKIFSWAA